MTVAGFRSLRAARQPGQLRDKRTQSQRSTALKRGRLTEREDFDLQSGSAAQGSGEKHAEGKQNRGSREPAQFSHFQLHPSLRDAQLLCSVRLLSVTVSSSLVSNVMLADANRSTVVVPTLICK